MTYSIITTCVKNKCIYVTHYSLIQLSFQRTSNEKNLRITDTYCEQNPLVCFNTIDSCKDGSLIINTVRMGSEYEWVENLTVTSLNGTNFTGGERIEIKGVFDCDWDGDELSFAYNNGTGWRNIYDNTCAADQKFTFLFNFTLDDLRGVHSVRATIAYDGVTGMTCSYDSDTEYSDTDDVSFFVISDFETNPPEVKNIKPLPGKFYEFQLPKTFMIEAEVTDDLAVDTVSANISWGAYEESLMLVNIINDTWQGEFKSANMTGRYNITIIANDTNSNLNNTQATFFYFNKTTNITLLSPVNERWYPNYTVTLDYLIETGGQVLWTGYILGGGNLTNDTPPVAHTNNYPVVPAKSINGTALANLSQSFNLTENITVGRIRLKLKRAGYPQNLTLQIRNDTNNSPGAAIASSNLSSQISNTTFGWVNFTFTSPPILNEGKRYWLFILQNGTVQNHTLFEVNNNTYSSGQLLSNASLDLLFSIEDAYHYRTNVTLDTEMNNITAYANATSSAQLLSSPTAEFYVDRNPPEFSGFQYSPTTQENLDPGKGINVSIILSDEFNISSAILQYRLSNATLWINKSMQNNATSTYNASFTPTSEGNWTIQVYASDTLSNSNHSTAQSIQVLYERSYELNTTQFNETAGAFLATNTSLGMIGIKNTGDASLTFSITKSGSTVPQVYFNDEKAINITVQPAGMGWFNVTAEALDVEAESAISMNILPLQSAYSNRTTVNATLVSFVSGPYFLVSIKEYHASVVQGDQRIPLKAEITNVGNETADNVTLFWTLPDGWSAKENISKNISTFSTGQKETFRISSNIAPSAPTGTFNIQITAQNNLTNNTDTRTVTVSSKNPAPTDSGGSSTETVTTTITSIVEIGNPDLIINAPGIIEIRRGSNATFEINITNSETKNLTNITISLDGFILSYTKISPSFIETLPKGAARKISITLNTPMYLNPGKYPIILTAALPWKSKELVFKKEMALVILDANASEFAECIVHAKKQIEELQSHTYNTQALEQLLADARRLLIIKDYEQSKQNCEKISSLADDAKASKAMIDKLRSSLASPGSYSKSIDEALALAEDAFKRGDFTLSKHRAKDAALLLEIERSGLRARLKSAFRKAAANWQLTLIFILTAGLSALLVYSTLSVNFTQRRISSLNEEEHSILELIRQNQRHRFKERAISGRVYEKRMAAYRERLAKIQGEKNALRLKLASFEGYSKKKSIPLQIGLITSFKKELQEEFYIKRIIDKKSYDKMGSEYNSILSELKEKLERIKDEEKKR